MALVRAGSDENESKGYPPGCFSRGTSAENEQGECMNKTMALAAVLIFCVPVIAQENPADYPQKAHIASLVSPKDGPIPGPPLKCSPPRLGETMIQVGDTLYTVECRQKGVEVGQDYPAKLYEKTVILLINGKAISFRVRGKQAAVKP
jgi:hypothetical protein